MRGIGVFILTGSSEFFPFFILDLALDLDLDLDFLLGAANGGRFIYCAQKPKAD